MKGTNKVGEFLVYPYGKEDFLGAFTSWLNNIVI